jgi:hypothetical protein
MPLKCRVLTARIGTHVQDSAPLCGTVPQGESFHWEKAANSCVFRISPALSVAGNGGLGVEAIGLCASAGF